MHPKPYLVAALAALTLVGADAMAASVTCQSRNMQREECALRGRGEVVLVRQLSKTTCVKGRNWDETRDGVVVDDGCGGIFETRDVGNGRPGDRPGQGGGWSGGPGPGNSGADYRDLVGVRAASGTSELQRRGFREARNEPVQAGRLVFWRTPARGCIEVRVADGRFQAIRPVANGACEGGRPVPGGSGRPPGSVGVAACVMQFTNQSGNEATVDSQSRLRPGVWEILLQYAGRRYSCLVNDRGQVISYKQIP